MKVAAVIVIFKPCLKQLSGNIDSLINDVSRLLIFQNSILDRDFVNTVNMKYREKIVVLGTGENVGIATALNCAARWALNNRYDFLLSLDQDSYFAKGALNLYKEKIQSYPRLDEVGVFGININNRGNLLYSQDAEHIQVAETITSGSMYPISIFERGIYFQDELFIDAVDYEFCYRLQTDFGLKTIAFTKVFLEHEVGEAFKTIWGFKSDNYSAFRTYYILRNQLIIWRRYPNLFSALYKKTYIKTHLIGRMLKIILGERDKYLKLKAIFVGFIHGLKGKTGFYHIK